MITIFAPTKSDKSLLPVIYCLCCHLHLNESISISLIKMFELLWWFLKKSWISGKRIFGICIKVHNSLSIILLLCRYAPKVPCSSFLHNKKKSFSTQNPIITKWNGGTFGNLLGVIAQYKFWNSKILAPVVCFMDLV